MTLAGLIEKLISNNEHGKTSKQPRLPSSYLVFKLGPPFHPLSPCLSTEIITLHSMLVSSVGKCRALFLKMIVVGFGWGGILSFEDFEIQTAVFSTG